MSKSSWDGLEHRHVTDWRCVDCKTKVMGGQHVSTRTYTIHGETEDYVEVRHSVRCFDCQGDLEAREVKVT